LSAINCLQCFDTVGQASETAFNW